MHSSEHREFNLCFNQRVLDRGKNEPYLVDLRKCLDVANSVLGSTTEAVTEAFQELLKEQVSDSITSKATLLVSGPF